MKANRLAYTFPLLLAVAVRLPAQQPASPPPGFVLDQPRGFAAAQSLQQELEKAQAACELEDAQFAYDLDARSNHVRLDKPQYTNAPWSEMRLRASALAGDGLAASLCSGSNASNELFWLSLAATNGWLASQVRLAKDLEIPPLPAGAVLDVFDKLGHKGLEAILKQPQDMRRAAATFWRSKAEAGLPKLKADAAHGYPRALYALGLLHESGDLVESNAFLAAEMFLKAAESGLAPAQESWGLYCAWHLTNGLEAARWYYRAATQGLAMAQDDLRELHGEPTQWRFDPRFQPKASERARWTFEIASQAIACHITCRACIDMGSLCLGGLGVERNAVEAVKWYHRAIDLGTSDGGGEYGLALCYFGGDGVPQDDVEGSKWLQKAKQKGYNVDPPWEAYGATDAAEHGDDHAAIRYWRKDAALGDAEAECKLGIAYRDGKGVTRDGVAAAQWFQKAAEQGEPTAQFYLGLMFEDGQGVPQDYTEAIKWYLKAANQDDANSQNNLGVMYVSGQGVPQDYVEAYKWYNLAASHGNTKSIDNRDRLAAYLTPSQIAEGQRLSRGFVPRKHGKSLSPDFTSASADAAPTAAGTGFFITDDGYLISNYHTVKDAAQVRLLTRAGTILAKVVATDAADDLALLKAEGRFSPLPIAASRTVKMGSTVATIGFPNIGLQGFAPKLAKGEVAALSGAQDDPRFFQISVPVQPGNSGGALVDERGNVVGVVTAKLDAAAALTTSGALPENVNYAVKSSFLLSFLESVPDVAAKLDEPSAKQRKFEDVVKSAEKAAVLVLVY